MKFQWRSVHLHHFASFCITCSLPSCQCVGKSKGSAQVRAWPAPEWHGTWWHLLICDILVTEREVIHGLRCQLTVPSPPHQLRTADGCDSSHDSSARPESGKISKSNWSSDSQIAKVSEWRKSKTIQGKVQSSEAWYDSFGFYIFLICIGSKSSTQ